MGSLIFISILFGQSLQAQQEEPYLIRSDEVAPEWVLRMYQKDADPGEVMRLYKEYYSTHAFVKNQHTQYYKRWISGLGKAVIAHPESDREYLKQYEKAKSQRMPTAWTPVGPIDWDHSAAAKSYAPGSAHVYTVEQSVSNQDILFAGTANAGIWKSTNHGLNWSACTRDFLTGSVLALEI
nr:hypothetical protein [Bacteroidota bacterium]